MISGVLLELVNVVAVIGIAVFMFPILRKQHEALALGYVAFRILEAVLLIVAVVSPLLLIALSQAYLAAGAAEVTNFQTFGTLFITARAHLSGLLLTVFFSLGALGILLFAVSDKTRSTMDFSLGSHCSRTGVNMEPYRDFWH